MKGLDQALIVSKTDKKDRGALLQTVISRIADNIPCQIKLHPLRHDEDIENFCKDLKIHPKILNR